MISYIMLINLWGSRDICIYDCMQWVFVKKLFIYVVLKTFFLLREFRIPAFVMISCSFSIQTRFPIKIVFLTFLFIYIYKVPYLLVMVAELV
jgi:hypothetical protein